MKVTKRNGNLVIYDDEKVANSIVWANGRTSNEVITISRAEAIADEVFRRLTAEKDIITTAEIRDCVYKVLKEQGYPDTAENYINYKAN